MVAGLLLFCCRTSCVEAPLLLRRPCGIIARGVGNYQEVPGSSPLVPQKLEICLKPSAGKAAGTPVSSPGPSTPTGHPARFYGVGGSAGEGRGRGVAEATKPQRAAAPCTVGLTPWAGRPTAGLLLSGVCLRSQLFGFHQVNEMGNKYAASYPTRLGAPQLRPELEGEGRGDRCPLQL